MQLARWGVVAIALVATALSGEGRITAGSSQIVRLRLVVDTTPVVLSEREGEMARIDIRGEQVLGVIPAIDTCATNGPCLAIVQITLDPATGEETLQDLWHVELKVGQTVRFDGAVVPVEIKLVGISAAGAQPPVPNGPCQKCCVICDGITTAPVRWKPPVETAVVQTAVPANRRTTQPACRRSGPHRGGGRQHPVLRRTTRACRPIDVSVRRMHQGDRSHAGLRAEPSLCQARREHIGLNQEEVTKIQLDQDRHVRFLQRDELRNMDLARGFLFLGRDQVGLAAGNDASRYVPNRNPEPMSRAILKPEEDSHWARSAESGHRLTGRTATVKESGSLPGDPCGGLVAWICHECEPDEDSEQENPS